MPTNNQYGAVRPSDDWHNPAYKNKAHCFWCGKTLKKMPGTNPFKPVWTAVCRRCGRMQPWYTDQPAPTVPATGA